MFLKKLIKSNRLLTETYYKYKRIDPNKYLIGMTSVEERNFWEQYARENYEGIGEMADLGCWFGSTTIPLVRGMLQNPKMKNSSKRLFAYDMFVWEDWMIPFVQHTKWEGKFLPGDDFLPAFKEVISPYKKYIKVIKADLTKEKWMGKPIEFLLVDAMKSWELLNSIQGQFYPFLIPGKSTIVHQDFSHYYTYWIHLLQYKFKNYFEFIRDISGGSAVFRLVEEIPGELLSKKYSVEDFSAEDIEAAFNYSLSLVAHEHKGCIEAARIMCYKDFYGETKARERLMHVHNSGLKNPDLTTVANIIGQPSAVPE